MTLVVETGAIISGANSYVSLADAGDYATRRGYDVTLTDQLLLRAADYINTYRDRFKGTKLTPVTSNMQFPRINVILDGYIVPSDQIPALIPAAQVETAVELAGGRDPQEAISTQIIKRQRIGPLEIEYDTESGVELPSFDFPKINDLLAPVLTDDLTRVYR